MKTNQPKIRSQDIGDADLQYLFYDGSGPTIILLHATGFLPWLWHPIARELSDSFQIIAPYFCDHRETDPAKGGLSWMKLADDVLFFRDHGFRSCDRRLLGLFGIMQIVVGEGIDITIAVVILHFRRVGIEEEIGQHVALVAIAKLQFIADPLPAALPQVLVFPLLRITDAWLGLDIVPPHVFGALAVRPYILAGDRAGVAANALLQIESHA